MPYLRDAVKHMRDEMVFGVTHSCCAPPFATRNPLLTSSMSKRLPWLLHRSRRRCSHSGRAEMLRQR